MEASPTFLPASSAVVGVAAAELRGDLAMQVCEVLMAVYLTGGGVSGVGRLVKLWPTTPSSRNVSKQKAQVLIAHSDDVTELPASLGLSRWMPQVLGPARCQKLLLLLQEAACRA